jgi:Na+-translocating ferredoxin:NAD+ oxidoreductase RNF subunit RnfB
MDFVAAFVIIGGLGLIFGGLLAYTAQRFAVEEDARVETICDLLPGANCGACGFPGCINFAEKVVKGEAAVDCCVPGGKGVCDNICEVLGVESVASEIKKMAEVYCIGTKDVAYDKFVYHGVPDCKAAMMYGGGFKACKYGCLGLGTCVGICPFDAMHMGANGLPQVDVERCTGCGVCAKACPRGVIRIVNADRTGKVVLCNSKDRGKATRQACEVGCIGCKACVKACPNEAVVVEDNLAYIDSTKCDDCGKCVEACTRDIIKNAVKIALS